MTDDEYIAELDREAVAHARKPFPDLRSFRRVRVDEAPRVAREMAQAVHADHERERRGADDATA